MISNSGALGVLKLGTAGASDLVDAVLGRTGQELNIGKRSREVGAVSKLNARRVEKSAQALSAADIEKARIAAEELELVEQTKAGDLNAYRQLFERYQGKARAIAYGVIRNREDANDIVQEAFLKAFKNLASFKGQSSFYTWFYRIVFNLAIDLSRRRYRHLESMFGESRDLDLAIALGSADAPGYGTVDDFGKTPVQPDEELNRLRLGKKISQALEQLSPEHRAVIVLREIDGLSYEEISEAVGCSKGTVMSRLHHARKKIQALLQDSLSDAQRQKLAV